MSVLSSFVAVEGSVVMMGFGLAVGAEVVAVVGAAVGAAVGATVAVGVAATVATGVAVVAATQVDRVMASLIRVTSPFLASARPFTLTPLFIVIDVRARMVPPKVEPDPSVAELVTCQKTLQGCAPLMKLTELDEAVTRSEVAWKIQTELGSF